MFKTALKTTEITKDEEMCLKNCIAKYHSAHYVVTQGAIELAMKNNAGVQKDT